MNNLQKNANTFSSYLMEVMKVRRREYYEEQKMKKIIYIFGFALILSLVLFLTIFVLYNKKLRKEASENLLSVKQMSDIVPNNDIEETSFSSDKTIENVNNTVNNTTKNTIKTTPVTAIVENNVTNTVESSREAKKEYLFTAPVSGEIIKDYAEDTLIYSNTLEEWTTHTGIDIRASKMSVVSAAEEGVVDSIKNDPRYGLTVTIKHGDEYKTVYANLLTAEFVKEGEEVEKGQTIGTVGDSASFEIADEPHLHFEIYKDGKNVNPTIYLKDY